MFICFFVNVFIRCYFIVFYIYLLSLHTLLHFSQQYFSTCIFMFPYLCIFIFSYFHNSIFSSFYTFIICVSDYVLLFMLLNVCVQLYVHVCNICFCACILSYLLWWGSHERQGMLAQWPAPDDMG